MTTTYPAGSKVVEVRSHTYYLKTDVAGKTSQLMRYDGTEQRGRADRRQRRRTEIRLLRRAAAADDDEAAGRRCASADDLWGAAGRSAGESCLFVNDGSPTPAPRLPVLGNGAHTAVPLTAAQLTDGPWCPNGVNVNRWDADLLRIRKIGGHAACAVRGGGVARPGRRALHQRRDITRRQQMGPRPGNPVPDLAAQSESRQVTDGRTSRRWHRDDNGYGGDAADERPRHRAGAHDLIGNHHRFELPRRVRGSLRGRRGAGAVDRTIW